MYWPLLQLCAFSGKTTIGQTCATRWLCPWWIPSTKSPVDALNTQKFSRQNWSFIICKCNGSHQLVGNKNVWFSYASSSLWIFRLDQRNWEDPQAMPPGKWLRQTACEKAKFKKKLNSAELCSWSYSQSLFFDVLRTCLVLRPIRHCAMSCFMAHKHVMEQQWWGIVSQLCGQPDKLLNISSVGRTPLRHMTLVDQLEKFAEFWLRWVRMTQDQPRLQMISEYAGCV